MSLAVTCAGADALINLQFGYGYDVVNGVLPYFASQTFQHTHAPTFQMPAGSAVNVNTSVGLVPFLQAGLKGNTLWSVASGQPLCCCQHLDCFA